MLMQLLAAGNGLACVGCDGLVNSGKITDVCGVCDGDSLSCLDCDGKPMGGKVRSLLDLLVLVQKYKC